MTIDHEPARAIPSVNGWPLLGVMPAMARDAPGLLLRAAREKGTPVRLPMGSNGPVLLSHPDELRHVLQAHTDNYIRGTSVDKVRPLLGNGLPLSDGDFWLRQRRTMQPAFGRARLATLTATMVREARKSVGALVDGQRYKAHELWLRVALDVILSTMFSDSLGDDYPAVEHALESISRYLGRYSFLPFDVPLWLPLPDQVAFRKACKTLDTVVYRIVESRKEAAPCDDLLDALIRARDPETGLPMEPRVLRDEVVNIFFAGHETTANMLTWTSAMLAQNPACEARMVSELDGVLEGREPGFDDLARLPYLSAVLRETLRLYPPAWIFARVAERDDVVRGHRMPKGTVSLLSPYVTHRDPTLWPEPERFDPERFLRDPSLGLGGTRTFTYVPFGAGPHLCIGNHFAMTEASVALAMLYQRGRLVPESREPPRTQVAATLQVAGSLPVRFVARSDGPTVAKT